MPTIPPALAASADVEIRVEIPEQKHMERREEEDRDGDDDEWEDQEVRQSPRSNGLVQCLKMWYCSIPFILFVTSFGFYIYGFVLVDHFSLLLGTYWSCACSVCPFPCLFLKYAPMSTGADADLLTAGI